MPPLKQGLFKESGKRYEGAVDADGPYVTTRIGLGFQNYAAGAAATVNYDFFVEPGVILDDCFMVLRKNFTGGTVASATISAGTAASPTLYILATSVFSGASAYIGATNAQKGTAFTSPQTILLGGTATVAATGTFRTQLIVNTNTNQLTQGWLDLFITAHIASVRP